MNLSLELTAEETAMLEKCAVRNNISTAEFIKNTILERIKDEMDMEVYETAMNKYSRNPRAYTHSSVMRELGLVK
ncbi:type II toxin-antitoxin system RelB family antitoxin [Mucispirillum schaedleri]|uniref:type II toxin-antitoxin system RelB family antitoxin n=1 Tax=Mucispirillum schaedleri TaxID=248039 RepID=UPI001F56DAAF|nr:DUF6290 family protein [Mucispirillum schaedleri]